MRISSSLVNHNVLSQYPNAMRIYVAGVNGLVGASISRVASLEGHEVRGRSSQELDFTRRDSTFDELLSVKADALIIAAAKVGGIKANSSFPVDFLTQNLQIQTNLIDAAHHAGIERVVFLGSSCVYPGGIQDPIDEKMLLTGVLEPTNAPYAIAKIAGLKLIEAYRNQYKKNWISVMPTNMYGPGDNFDIESGHVLPALIHKIHLAKINSLEHVEIWGDGTPLREFLHVDDLAKACLFLLENYDGDLPINVGSGREISIQDLAKLISTLIGYEGKLVFNSKMPNGTSRKFLNSDRILALGWEPRISLETGIEQTYDWFVANHWKGSSN